MKAKLILLKKSNGREQFVIRLSHKGKKAYQAIDVPFTSKEWNYKPKPKDGNQKYKKSDLKNELKGVHSSSAKYKAYTRNKKFVKSIEDKYNNVINELIEAGRPYSFQKVFDMVNNPKKEKFVTLFEVFNKKIAELRENEKYSNAENYKGTLSKLKKFGNDRLFNEADAKYLLKFKKYLRKNGLSNASISIHLRNIRTIFNYAIKEGIAQRNDYPFINSEIMKDIPTAYRSIALSKHDVDNIRRLRKELDEGSDLWHTCNYFIFGYVGRGINFQDMARLKWSNLHQGRINYIRRKTRGKTQDEISIRIVDELSEILRYYRTHDIQLNNPYIFPILNASHETELSKHYRIKKIRKKVNADLKIIGEMIGVDVPITTYTWRHTFAAVAKNELKVSVTMISEMLGHHDKKVTEHYLEQFPDDDKDKAVAGL